VSETGPERASGDPIASTTASSRGEPAPAPAGLWQRLQDHKVLQWALAYLGAALAIAHGGELLGHSFHWPEVANRLLMGALIVGFPVALALAWYHGHRSLTKVSFAEATIISLLLVLGAGMLIVFVPESGERSSERAAAPASRAAATTTGPSIAVLPFINMSSDREQEYFSDGLSEELLNRLAQLPGLRVIGRTSSFAFKGKSEDLRSIGEVLGVNHILEGSVRKSGDQVRITAQLINPADGSHLWSDTYDRNLGDIFAIQEDIARTVAGALRISIGARDLRQGGTQNLEAYDAYLRGRSLGIGGISSFERAVELDPQFTAAWVMLAESYGSIRLTDPGRKDWPQKEDRAIDRVEQLAPGSPVAKLLRGRRAYAAGDLRQADSLLASLADLPSSLSGEGYDAYGTFLLSTGRPKAALEVLTQAQQIDPINVGTSIGLQINYEILEDYEKADVEYRRMVTFAGDNPLSHSAATLRAMARHDTEGTRKLLSTTEDDLAHMLSDRGIKVMLLPNLENPAAALAELRRAYTDPAFDAKPIPLVATAHWAAYLGDPEFSLQAFRRMWQTGAPRDSLFFSLWRPVEREMRKLPAFKDFVREAGLVDYWRTSGNWSEFCRPEGKDDFTCT
jgi:TolB-like protein